MAYFECMIGGSGDGSTLTVTCYSGFAGSTISITNGVDTYSDVCPSSSPYEVVFSGLANGTWTISGIYDGTTYTKTVEVNLDTEFYPIPIGATATPVNVIQTWLHCADIWDKNYTTINQVLADTSTLLALISSNNAADYMARSTNWASSVCANQTAMGYIGNNDYCANKLLANSTWLNAICNSTYMESVLNVKVPTMTSNTAPYGVASGSGNYSSTSDYYKAFNADNSDNGWQSNSSSSSGQWLQYEFPSAVKILMATCTRYTAGSGTYKIQAANSGSFEDISSATNSDTVICNPEQKYKKYRAYFTQNTYDQRVIVAQLQFYGRA